MNPMYKCFTRSWWRIEGDQRIPEAGPKRYIRNAVFDKASDARDFCQRWNENRSPALKNDPRSIKCEFESV